MLTDIRVHRTNDANGVYGRHHITYHQLIFSIQTKFI